MGTESVSRGSENVVPGPAAAASPGKYIVMEALRLHPDFLKQKLWSLAVLALTFQVMLIHVQV